MKKQSHRAQVQSWAKATTRGLTSAQRVTTYVRALNAVSQRAERTLGEVTVQAVLRRVLVEGRSGAPVLEALLLEGGTLRFEPASNPGAASDEAVLDAAFLSFLTALLTLMDSLTGGILTPALQTELNQVRAERAAKARKPR